MSRFTQVVRQTLIANRVEGRKPDSIRGLARVMGQGDEARAETYKRSLFKWMAEGDPNPSPASRALVARALGIDAAELDEDDAEEGDLAAQLARMITALVRAELRRNEKETTATDHELRHGGRQEHAGRKALHGSAAR